MPIAGGHSRPKRDRCRVSDAAGSLQVLEIPREGMLIADVVFFAVALALSLFVRVHRVGGGCAQVRGSSGPWRPRAGTAPAPDPSRPPYFRARYRPPRNYYRDTRETRYP